MAAWTEIGEADLMDGDVTVRVSHSTINYKDGLAITGKAPVVRRWPMIPGIDFAGTVIAVRHAGFKPGDEVILNGWGVGETHLRRLRADARASRATGWSSSRAAFTPAADHGDRHRRLHGDAVRPGAGAARRDAGQRPGAGHGRRRRRRQRRHRAARRSSATRSPPPPGGASEEPTTSRRSAPARSSTARELSGTPRPLARSAGPAPSTRSAAPRSPTCFSMTNTAARSPPAAWRRAWTCRPPSRRSSCAASRWPASTASWRPRSAARPGRGSPRPRPHQARRHDPDPTARRRRGIAADILAGKVRGRVVLEIK